MAYDTYGVYSFTIQDRFGTKATIEFPYVFDSGVATFADIRDQFVGLGDALDDVTDGIIVGGRITFEYAPEDGWKVVPSDDSFVERTGIQQFGQLTTKYLFSVAVPSISNSEIAPDGKISGGAWDTFRETLLTDSSSLAFTDRNMIVQTLGKGAYVSVRKKRKQLDRSTMEPGA